MTVSSQSSSGSSTRSSADKKPRKGRVGAREGLVDGKKDESAEGDEVNIRIPLEEASINVKVGQQRGALRGFWVRM